MILELIVASQIFMLIIMVTRQIALRKETKKERLAEVRRLNYMAEINTPDSASSMEEGFDVDFDRTQQPVWSRARVSKASTALLRAS